MREDERRDELAGRGGRRPGAASRRRRAAGAGRADRSSHRAAPVRRTSPIESQVPARTPIAGAGHDIARQDTRSTDDTSWSGATNAMRISATSRPSSACSQPSCSPLTSSVPAASARKPSGSGLPIGRRTIRACSVSSRTHQRLRRRLLHARAQPLQLDAAVSPSHARTTSSRSWSRSSLGGLADQRPGDVALGGHQVQVVEVAQQAQRRPCACPGRARSAGGPARSGASSP